MRPSQHTEFEIHRFLNEASTGLPISEICKVAHISSRTFYRWRSRYGGVTPSAVRAVKDLQLENNRLRALVVSLSVRTGIDAAARTAPHVAVLRQDHGGGTASPQDTGGASLGRFAFVRGHR